MVTKEDIINRDQEAFESWLSHQPYTQTESNEEWRKFEKWCEQEALQINKDEENIYFESYYTKEKHKEIKIHAKQQNIISLKQEYLKLFSERSFYNETFGEILFYIYIALFIKHKQHFIGTKWITPVLHSFIIQNSSSGKDQGLDFFIELVQKTNKFLLKNARYQMKPIKYYELSGTETVETFINHYAQSIKKNSTYDFKKIIKGCLEANDLIVSRECSYFFLERRGDKQTRSEILLTAMEGRPIEKALIGWQGHKTTTNMNACFIGLSRPIRGMKNHILSSGFQQRALNLCREIDSELRDNMLKDVGLFAHLTPEDVDSRDKRMNTFIRNFCLMISTTNFKKLTHHNMVQNSKFVVDKLREFSKDIVDTINRRQHRDILESFIGRYKDLALIIAYEEAVLRKQHKIDLIDYENAFALIRKTYDYLKVWIENVVIEDKIEYKRRTAFKSIVRKIFIEYMKTSTTRNIKNSILVELISKKLSLSTSTAHERIKSYSQGKNSFLIKKGPKNNTLVSLRKQ